MSTARVRVEDLDQSIIDELVSISECFDDLEPTLDRLRARYARYGHQQDRATLVKGLALKETLDARWDVLTAGVDFESEAA